MTLDDETAERIAREVIGGGKATRVYLHPKDLALVRAGYAARDAEVEELRAAEPDECSCRGEYVTALDLVDGCKCGRLKPFREMTDEEVNAAASPATRETVTEAKAARWKATTESADALLRAVMAELDIRPDEDPVLAVRGIVAGIRNDEREKAAQIADRMHGVGNDIVARRIREQGKEQDHG